jgi:hypothetical protein
VSVVLAFESFSGPVAFQWPVHCHKKKVKWRKGNDTCWITWSQLLFSLSFSSVASSLLILLFYFLCNFRKLGVSLARKARSSNVFVRRYVSWSYGVLI